MTQVQGLPEPPDVHSQNVDISAQDGGVAAYQIGQLNNHISVDGLAVLQELLQLNEDLKNPDGDSASQIKRHLSQQKPDMGVRELIALELRRMRTLREFALDDYNNYDPDYAHALSERVIEAARLPVAVVAVMAFWGDPDTDRWWAADLERLSRIRRRGGAKASLEKNSAWTSKRNGTDTSR
jgi:hypothetical protein